MVQETYEYSSEQYKKLGDAIIWTTLLAAVHKDGKIEEAERAEAIKQTHIRSFSTEDYIKPIYEHLDEHFEKDFDAYSAQLPKEYEAKEVYIQGKLTECMNVLSDMGPVFTAIFSRDLESMFDRVFNANANLFQSLLFPFISGHLEDKNKRQI